MITWVTVWVLTVGYYGRYDSQYYQLTFKSKAECVAHIPVHKEGSREGRCDFQQIPLVTK